MQINVKLTRSTGANTDYYKPSKIVFLVSVFPVFGDMI